MESERTMERQRKKAGAAASKPKGKALTVHEATERLVAITEAHLSNLTPRERQARLRAFREVVSTVGRVRARSSGHSQNPRIPLAARGRGVPQ